MESCSSYFLPRLVGFSNASYLVSTGAVFPPTAKHFGDLFNEVLPDPSHVLPRALELATEIAENVSPTSQYLNRALMWRNPGTPEGAHLLESAVICQIFGSAYVHISSGSFQISRRMHPFQWLTTKTETRMRGSNPSLRSANPHSGPIWMTIRPVMCPGGLKLTPEGVQKQGKRVRPNCDSDVESVRLRILFDRSFAAALPNYARDFECDSPVYQSNCRVRLTGQRAVQEVNL